MDMWKAFRKATELHAPQAAILYDKFHVLRQLNDAMDTVRKAEYKRLTNREDRTFIKGQRSSLRSSGTIGAKRGPGSFPRTGERRFAGNDSSRSRSSPR